VQQLGETGVGPVLFSGVEQARRTAHPGFPFAPVRHDSLEVGHREAAARLGVLLDQPQAGVSRSHGPQRCAKDHFVAIAR